MNEGKGISLRKEFKNGIIENNTFSMEQKQWINEHKDVISDADSIMNNYQKIQNVLAEIQISVF